MKIRYTKLFLPSVLVDENTKFVFFKREQVYWMYSYLLGYHQFITVTLQARLFTNDKKEIFSAKNKSLKNDNVI